MVLCEVGIEWLYSSLLNVEYWFGMFVCVGCDFVLFLLVIKFDSYMGWLSFWKLFDYVVGIDIDVLFGMVCIEVYCCCCGGYFGYVFDDGLVLIGLCYCMNGVVFVFYLVVV